MIEEITNNVLHKLLLTPSKDSEDFVGIEDHIAEMSKLLQLESEKVRMVGLWGSSGIGKTTIARVLFNRLSRHFQGSIFIDKGFLSKSMETYNNANPDDYNMKLYLQRKFLSKLLGKKEIHIDRLGAVGERLKHHKVLIFIDDLDDQVVLDALVGQSQWFGCGSRIIVVTNDRHFLRAHGIKHIYEVCLPSEELAEEMLCRSAFRKTSPPEGFEKLADEVARLAGNLLLGLSVLGSSLRGRDKEYWVDLLPRLQNGLDGKIERTLRFSYDGLGSEDKAIFRHIACLFNGAGVTYIKLLLADSNLGVNIGLKNLADKSLVHERCGRVEMHRLLQEMGRSIVRLDEPEKREFLVDSQDICDVLNDGTGTKKVLGISLNIDEIDELHIHESAFKGMRNLRFLEIKETTPGKLHFPKNFDYLPSTLRLLCWPGYPMRCMPSKFLPQYLVRLDMSLSKLEKLWEGVVSLTCLKEINLWGSLNLIQIPDLSKATNLETLELAYCSSLVELPSSIPHPNKLKRLNTMDCSNLETITICINLKSLDYLCLEGCSRLKTFPEISTNITKIFIDFTSIEEFPSNLRLESLRTLSMNNLKDEKLWEGVQLTFLTAMLSPSLVSLYLSNIPLLVEPPSSFQNLHQLESLEIANCVNLETLPTGINLQSLDRLVLSGCSRLRTFPDISTNISYLDLGKTAIEELPWWIEKFSRLEVLEMNGCNKLQYVNLHISELKCFRKVEFSDCKALTGASWNDYDSRDVNINFTNCFNLDQEALFQQKTYHNYQVRLSGEEMPSYFTHRTTGTSSSLTVPLLHNYLSQPFLRFRACLVFDYDTVVVLGRGQRYPSFVYFYFKGRFWNSFDSLGQPQDFRAGTNKYDLDSDKKETLLLITDCRIPLSKDSAIFAEMNYNHVDLQIHISSPSWYRIKEWGIRVLEDCSSSENQLGNPNTLPHVFEADQDNMLNEAAEQVEECGGEDKVKETSSKRMRIS